MAKLQDRLDRIKQKFTDGAPAEALDVMERATESLRTSGILSRLPAVGSRLTPFDLPDSDGNRVRSDDLLARGPVVVTFYRGVW